jgi:ATP-binding cassette subfamily B protein/ATP-binding cassette subfamily C protein LapB
VHTAFLSGFISRHRSALIEILVCGFLVNVFALALPVFSSFAYDKIIGNYIHETLWGLTIAIALVFMLDFGVRQIRTIIAERLAHTSNQTIDTAIMRQLVRTDLASMPPLGGLLERYKQLAASRDFLSSSYLLALVDALFLGLFLLVMGWAAGLLVLVPLLCGLLMLAISALTTKIVLTYDGISRKAGEDKMRVLVGFMAGREAVVGGAQHQAVTTQWLDAADRTSQAEGGARFWRGVGYNVTSMLSNMSYIGVIVGGVYMVESHDLTSGGLLAAAMLGQRAIAAFGSVVTLVLKYKEFKLAIRDMNAVMPEAAQDVTLPDHGRLTGAISIQGVTATLGQGQMARQVLDIPVLDIPAGSLIGIAGPAGSGKTTLLRLIAGLLKPTQGQILIDHLPLHRLSGADLTLNIGYKPQDPCLLPGTIESNVQAGRDPLTPEQLGALAATSGLMLAFKENGLSWAHEITTHNPGLSGGQQQLVALARAFYSHNAVLLLDEPTTGLDAVLEQHVIQQIIQRKRQQTIIISTHHQGLLRLCDRLIVIRNGKIAADAPPDRVLNPPAAQVRQTA